MPGMMTSLIIRSIVAGVLLGQGQGLLAVGGLEDFVAAGAQQQGG
jgi:hypothetical protein